MAGCARAPRSLSRPTPRLRRAGKPEGRIPPFAAWSGGRERRDSPALRARPAACRDRCERRRRSRLRARRSRAGPRPARRMPVVGRSASGCPDRSQVGRGALLGLPAISVLAKSPQAAGKLLLQRYHETLPERELPPLRIELLRGDAEYNGRLSEYLMSLRMMRNHECPTGPASPGLPKYQAPPSGVPGLLDGVA